MWFSFPSVTLRETEFDTPGLGTKSTSLDLDRGGNEWFVLKYAPFIS